MADLAVSYDGPVVSRKEARASGLKRYFTGKPCRHGHIAERQSRGSACVECVRLRVVPSNYDYVKAWKVKNPEKVAAAHKRYAKKHPETSRNAVKRYNIRHRERLLPELAAKAREKRKSDPEGNKRRIAAFKARQEEILTEIAGRSRPDLCELCGEFHLRIVFDHCHVGGHFRGWICDRCNKALGIVKDSIKLLRNMADYVERNNGSVDLGKAQQPLDQDFRISEVTEVSDTG